MATVKTQVSVLLPSWVVTVMVAVPADMVVTTPLRTVATASLLLVQVTALFVAFSGDTVAVSVKLSPAARVVTF
jgi:hypothetical protein